MTGEQGRAPPLPSQENLIASPVLPSQGACVAVRMLGYRYGFPVCFTGSHQACRARRCLNRKASRRQ